MSSTSLMISFQPPEDDSNYWVKITQDEPYSGSLTVSEAGEIVDSLYGLNACDSETSDEDSEIQASESSFDLVYVDTIYTVAGIPSVRYQVDYSWNGQFVIYLSHYGLGYSFKLSNAYESEDREIKQKEITQLVTISGNSFTLDYTLYEITEFSLDIDYIDGSTVYLTESYDDVFEISYIVQYIVVSFHVQAIQTAEQRVFESVLVNGNLARVEYDIISIISTRHQIDHFEGNKIYFVNSYSNETIEITYNGDVPVRNSDGTYTTDGLQPAAVMVFFEGLVEHYKLDNPTMEDLSVISYTYNLPSYFVGNWEGESEDFYLENCCTEFPEDIDIPDSQDLVEDYYGGEKVNTNGITYGSNFVFVPVLPYDNICGEYRQTQVIDPIDCDPEDPDNPCYGVSDLQHSAGTVITINSSQSVSFSGGKAPYYITIRGDGAGLDEGATQRSTIKYSTGSFKIYTGDNVRSDKIYFTIRDHCGQTTSGFFYVYYDDHGVWWRWRWKYDVKSCSYSTGSTGNTAPRDSLISACAADIEYDSETGGGGGWYTLSVPGKTYDTDREYGAYSRYSVQIGIPGSSTVSPGASKQYRYNQEHYIELANLSDETVTIQIRQWNDDYSFYYNSRFSDNEDILRSEYSTTIQVTLDPQETYTYDIDVPSPPELHGSDTWTYFPASNTQSIVLFYSHRYQIYITRLENE